MSNVFPSDELLANTDDVLCPYAESFAEIANPSATYMQSGRNSFAEWSMNNAKSCISGRLFLPPKTEWLQINRKCIWKFEFWYFLRT